MDEVKILKALQHVCMSFVCKIPAHFIQFLQPCVIHIEDLFETPSALYIVLEL